VDPGNVLNEFLGQPPLSPSGDARPSKGTVLSTGKVAQGVYRQDQHGPDAAQGHEKSRAGWDVLAALGIVFGDIGTSPLYTFNEIQLHAHLHAGPQGHIYGACSLIFWAVMLIMCVKYMIVLRADNQGEGGTLALLALLRQSKGRFARLLTGTVLVYAASNLLGEAGLTAPISVLSAWEGTKPITDWFTQSRVVGFTVVTLAILFGVQKRGTEGIARVFAPWMVCWFGAIATTGILSIIKHPEILAAVNPLYGLEFLMYEWRSASGLLGPMAVLAVLGSVTLSFTGGEALYADMGHFNARAIRTAWLMIWPCLMCNYFGQAARLLDPTPIPQDNIFFAIVPGGNVGLTAMVVLAVGATCIASQALISGAYSICSAAVNQGYLPRMEVVPTSNHHAGQIYMPAVNMALFGMCLLLVVWKRSSNNLAAAYGMAVTLVMLSTSLGMIALSQSVWNWARWKALGVFLPFVFIDLAFVTANAMKFMAGAYIPICLGAFFFLIMKTQKEGRELLGRKISGGLMEVGTLLDDMRRVKPNRVKRPAIYLTANGTGVPPAFLHNLKHNMVVHDLVVFLTVQITHTPTVSDDERLKVEDLGEGFWRVIARHGFSSGDQPDVMKVISLVNSRAEASHGGSSLFIDSNNASFFLGRETLLVNGTQGMSTLRKRLFMVLARLGRNPALFFGIPPNQVVELGTQIEL
jgi:KUP system potassium uptake protein